jgi:hypothetical protein
MVADTVILKLWNYVSSMGIINIVSGIRRMIAKAPPSNGRRQLRSNQEAQSRSKHIAQEE